MNVNNVNIEGLTQRERYHHGNLRAALLGAALAVLLESGPDALSLRGVAKRAGVSASAPYNHFRNKGALLAELAADRRARAGEALRDLARRSSVALMRASSSSSSAALELRVCFLLQGLKWLAHGSLAWKGGGEERVCALLVQSLFDVFGASAAAGCGLCRF